MKIIIITFVFLMCSFFHYGQKIDTFDIGSQFIPAGYMGCTENINIQDAWNINSHSKPFCYKISFTQSCTKGWAGVYWTNTAVDTGANWGQLPGTNLTKSGFTKLSFWVRGEDGNEVVEFGCGGIGDIAKYKYKDSLPKTTIKGKTIILTKEWTKFTIDLKDNDFSSVIGGFYWTAKWNSNTSGLIFYLDDITFVK